MPRTRTSFVFAALLCAILVSNSFGCRRHPPKTDRPPDLESDAEIAPAQQLKIDDLHIGSGNAAAPGSRVSIDYTGWVNGAKFDTTLNRKPLEFRLGKGEVLRGWDVGIPGMKEGGKRRLTVPPELGYGARGSLGGAIPPNSVLVFEIELRNVAQVP